MSDCIGWVKDYGIRAVSLAGILAAAGCTGNSNVRPDASEGILLYYAAFPEAPKSYDAQKEIDMRKKEKDRKAEDNESGKPQEQYAAQKKE